MRHRTAEQAKGALASMAEAPPAGRMFELSPFGVLVADAPVYPLQSPRHTSKLVCSRLNRGGNGETL